MKLDSTNLAKSTPFFISIFRETGYYAGAKSTEFFSAEKQLSENSAHAWLAVVDSKWESHRLVALLEDCSLMISDLS